MVLKIDECSLDILPYSISLKRENILTSMAVEFKQTNKQTNKLQIVQDICP